MSDGNREEPGIRPGDRSDLPAINTIYNRYVVETPVTFDVTPLSLAEHEAWFEQFGPRGPHRLFVATVGPDIAGFACSKQFRHKEAYGTSVETTIYLAPIFSGRGLGKRLYGQLVTALIDEDVHRAYAGITLPNDASIALHERLGFRAVGTYEEVGRKLGSYWSVRWFEKRFA